MNADAVLSEVEGSRRFVCGFLNSVFFFKNYVVTTIDFNRWILIRWESNGRTKAATYDIGIYR